MTPRLLLLAVLSSAVLAACGGGGDGGATSTPAGDEPPEGAAEERFGSLEMIREGGSNTATYDVELAPNAGTVDAQTVAAALEEYDADTGRYVFDGGADLSGLAPGEVVLFEDHSLARIVAVQEDGGRTVVETEPATLAEYIDTGEVGWDYAVDFGDAAASGWLDEMRVFLGPTQLEPVRHEGPELKYSGKLGTYDLTIEIKPQGNRLNISAEATKSAGGQNLQYVANGWVENFRSQGNIRYDSGSLRGFRYQNSGFRGELDLKFVATRLGEDTELIAIPMRLDIPMSVGGIPMKLGLGANLKIIPHLSGESSSEVGFKVTYSGSKGFEWSPTSARALGSLDEKALSLTKGDTAGFSPVGLGIGLEFPVMQLSVLGGVVVPSMLVDTHISGFYSPDPACQTALVRIRGLIGISLGALGFEFLSSTTEVWKEEHEVEQGPGCGAFDDSSLVPGTVPAPLASLAGP